MFGERKWMMSHTPPVFVKYGEVIEGRRVAGFIENGSVEATDY
jgi:hypothetical protein